MSKKLSNIMVLSSLCLAGVVASPFLGFADNEPSGTSSVPSISTYQGFLSERANICESKRKSDDGWKEAGDNYLLQQSFTYPAVSTGVVNTGWKNIIETLSKNDSVYASAVSGVGNEPILSDLAYAREAYISQVNSMYACGVLQTKTSTIKTLQEMLKSRDSNIVQELQKQLARNEELLQKKGCKSGAGGSESQGASYQKILLDNVTYEYCNYRHYLAYLAAYSRENYNVQSSSISATGMTQDILNKAMSTDTQIQNEIIRAKDVYPKAIVAFSEFERNYPSHIILTYILDDYIKIRTALRGVMNPLGQVISKASNAQKK